MSVDLSPVEFTPEKFRAAVVEAFDAASDEVAGEAAAPSSEPSEPRLEAMLDKHLHFAVKDIGIALDYMDRRIFTHVLHDPVSGFNDLVSLRLDIAPDVTISRLVNVRELEQAAASRTEETALLRYAAQMVDETNAMIADAAAALADHPAGAV